MNLWGLYVSFGDKDHVLVIFPPLKLLIATLTPLKPSFVSELIPRVGSTSSVYQTSDSHSPVVGLDNPTGFPWKSQGVDP